MAAKIVFVGNTAWSLFNFRMNVMRRLKNEGYDVTAVAPLDHYASRIEAKGIRFIALRHLKAKGTNPLREYKLYQEFVGLYRELQPDLIFHYTIKPNIYGVMAASKMGIKTIAVTTGLGHVFLKNGLVSLIAKSLYKIALNKANEVWFLNQEDMDSFLENHIIDKKKAMLLPGEGVDIEWFKPMAKEIVNEDRLRFIYTGRMIADKGIVEFVEASRQLSEKGYKFESVLLGFMEVLNPSAISKAQMDDWVKRRLVIYHGPTSDVRPFIADADCVVLPSYYREGIPRSLLEAASMGKPIITTNNVGCRDVVDDNYTGFLCDVKNALSLAEKMEQMIQLTTEDRMKMGQRGREKVVAKFGDDLVFNIYITKLKQYLV